MEQSIDKAFNVTITSPDVQNPTSTTLLDVKKTAVVAATAALITAQALQNQFNTNGTNFDSQPVTILPS